MKEAILTLKGVRLKGNKEAAAQLVSFARFAVEREW
jgi:hypothetical protein